jgi:prepilin-type N-terminal cleavage/methylation domain-containing protein
MSRTRPTAPWAKANRSGFTLVELLVVIAIIGVLAGLLTVALFAAFGTGKDFILANEVSQVEMSLENFKNKYNCYPPDMSDFSNGSLSNGQLTFFNAFINKAYPRANRQAIADFRAWVLTEQNCQIDQAEALVLFLTLTSTDPIYPFGRATTPGNPATFVIPATNTLQSFHEFPPGTLVDADADGFPEFMQKNANGAPLVYFDARTYTSIPVATGALQVGFSNAGYANTTGVVTPYASGLTGTNYVFFNPKSFQLICAGQDGEFGVILGGSPSYPILNEATTTLLPRVTESDGDNIANFTSGKKFDAFLAQ